MQAGELHALLLRTERVCANRVAAHRLSAVASFCSQAVTAPPWVFDDEDLDPLSDHERWLLIRSQRERHHHFDHSECFITPDLALFFYLFIMRMGCTIRDAAAHFEIGPKTAQRLFAHVEAGFLFSLKREIGWPDAEARALHAGLMRWVAPYFNGIVGYTDGTPTVIMACGAEDSFINSKYGFHCKSVARPRPALASRQPAPRAVLTPYDAAPHRLHVCRRLSLASFSFPAATGRL